MTDRETREALAREVEEKVADLYRSRTRLGVNGGIVHHLGCMLADNAEVILAALRDKPAEPSPVSQTEAGGTGARMNSTPEMRARVRELADPNRCDFDKAVIAILDDLEAAREPGEPLTTGDEHENSILASDRPADEVRRRDAVHREPQPRGEDKVAHVPLGDASDGLAILSGGAPKALEPSPGSQRRETKAGGDAKGEPRPQSPRQWALWLAGHSMAARDRGNPYAERMLTGAAAELTRLARELLAAEAQRDKLAEALRPFARAAEAAELNDPDFPAEGAVLRASFDFWTRRLGRDNSEEVERDSVRMSDLRRARAVLAATEGGA